MSVVPSPQEIGPRFNLVSAVPISTLIVFVTAVLIAGAPGEAPNFELADARLDGLSAVNLGLLLLGAIAIALVLNAFQVAFVKALEGYWPAIPVLSAVKQHLIARHEARWDRLYAARSGRQIGGGRHSLLPPSRDRARELLAELPQRDRLMPTRLGNALRQAEDFAGDRYGLDAIGVIPRLYPLMPAQMVAIIDDARNALDVMASFVFVWLIATAFSFCVLLPYGPWLILPLVTFVLAWLSYLGCVSAARAYGQTLAWAVDLYRFCLYEQLRVELPRDHEAEQIFNRELMRFLQGRWILYKDKRPRWQPKYLHPRH